MTPTIPSVAPAPPQATSPAELVAALKRKAIDLRNRDADLLARAIALESQGIRPQTPTPASDEHAIARQLLNGLAPVETTQGSPGERLYQILVERRAIVIARDYLQSEETKARVLAVAAVMQERGADWMELQRQRAMTIVALRKLNTACAEFRKAVAREAGMTPGLVCDRTGGVLFANVVGDPAYVFLQDCVAARIITEKEFNDAR